VVSSQVGCKGIVGAHGRRSGCSGSSPASPEPVKRFSRSTSHFFYSVTLTRAHICFGPRAERSVPMHRSASSWDAAGGRLIVTARVSSSGPLGPRCCAEVLPNALEYWLLIISVSRGRSSSGLASSFADVKWRPIVSMSASGTSTPLLRSLGGPAAVTPSGGGRADFRCPHSAGDLGHRCLSGPGPLRILASPGRSCSCTSRDAAHHHWTLGHQAPSPPRHRKAGRTVTSPSAVFG
jgi:hypothetical protein